MGEKVTILGGGSWGTAIAELLAQNGHQVLLYLRKVEQSESINKYHINKRYFPKHRLATEIKATANLDEAVKHGSYLFLTVPTSATREIMKKISLLLRDGQIIISTAKGFEEGTLLRNSEIINLFTDLPITVLSGPTHAEEVIDSLPTVVVIAAQEKNLANRIQDIMMSSNFRVYTNPDLVGVEVGGAVKNIIALAAGIADGLGYGDNTKAALITRGLHEMSRLGLYFGGELLTFAGLAGLGDLVVTCTSKHSRNRNFGLKIGQGFSLKDSLKSINQVVEGVKTTKALYQWYQKQKLDFELPITSQIYQVLFKQKDPLKAVDDLMLREQKHEIEEVALNFNW